jgi:hypothetical protein
MNRLLNALAFAAVVIAAFVMDSNLPQRLASNHVVARVVCRLRGNALPPVVALDGLPPQFDQARLDRAMQRMQMAQERLAQVDMRRVETQIRTATALSKCKVVKIEQDLPETP